MIVLDASAAVELLVRTPVGAQVIDRIAGEQLHAPHLLVLEVVQVLRRQQAHDPRETERASDALLDLRELGIFHHGHAFLLDRVWELRANLSAYDAAYVALAEVLDAPLLTCDARLAAAPGHGAAVELVA